MINAFNICLQLCKLNSISMEHPYWTVMPFPVTGGTLGTATHFTSKELRLKAQPLTLRLSLRVAGGNCVTKVLTNIIKFEMALKYKQTEVATQPSSAWSTCANWLAWWDREVISGLVCLRCWPQIQNLPASASFISNLIDSLPPGAFELLTIFKGLMVTIHYHTDFFLILLYMHTDYCLKRMFY